MDNSIKQRLLALTNLVLEGLNHAVEAPIESTLQILQDAGDALNSIDESLMKSLSTARYHAYDEAYEPIARIFDTLHVEGLEEKAFRQAAKALKKHVMQLRRMLSAEAVSA